jgi:hypothetical protein
MIPLVGKRPRDTGWRLNDYSPEECQAWISTGGNVGVRLRDDDLVVDADPRNFPAGDNVLARLTSTFGIGDCPVVETGGGGWHLYLKKPPHLAVAGHLADFPGIDLKSVGGQVVAAGSIHPDSGRLYDWDPLYDSDLTTTPDAPEALLDALKKPDITPSEPGDLSAEQLAELLTGLDPTDWREHDRWRNLMMACHHATGGEGMAEFVAWSTSDPVYSDHIPSIEKRWGSLGRKGGITAETLFRALHDAGQAALIDKVLRADPLDDFEDDLEPLPDTRTAIEKLADDWVWVVTAELFIRRRDTRKFSEKQWKSMHAGLWPEGDIVHAVWKGRLPVRKFEVLTYLPEASEFPDGEGGARYNIWRRSDIEAKAGDVSVFLSHLEYLVPNPADRSHVLDYMALLVQHPAEKVNFALLVHGKQGTGKSWIGELMTRIIGRRNVVRPSNDEVTSRWTAWQEGAQLGVIEELMSLGRIEVANRLKPVITDPWLRIEDKGCKIYSIENHINLICFTNHEDALKIEAGDRRWLVVFSPAEQMGEAYYRQLFDFLQGPGPAAVKAWLVERKIALNGKGVAPQTKGKEEMRLASMGEIEREVVELIHEEAAPFDFDLVRLEDVMDALPSDVASRTRNIKSRVIKVLRDAGAAKPSRYTKGDRPGYQLWVVRNHAQWEAAGATRRIEAFLDHQGS